MVKNTSIKDLPFRVPLGFLLAGIFILAFSIISSSKGFVVGSELLVGFVISLIFGTILVIGSLIVIGIKIFKILNQ